MSEIAPRAPLRQPRLSRLGLTAAAAALVAAAVVLLAGFTPRAEAADPNALWNVVHELCVTDMHSRGGPAPCARVDLAGGYAVLKDLRGATQILLVPTDRRTGIESAQLLAPNAPNYWQAAWAARSFFEKRAGRPVPRDDIGLAINSLYGRSQNQLHIHVDCVRPDVRQAIEAHQAEIGPQWSPPKLWLGGQAYRARRIDGEDLGAHDPFKLLAEEDPQARADMGRQTLVLVGVAFADSKPGFVLLSHRADPATGDKAIGENLLDHDCAVLGQATGARTIQAPA
jgi:CDP-diacylglycerol pyrophosphatase